MNKLKIVMSSLVIFTVCVVHSKNRSSKTKVTPIKEPSILMAMDIKNSIAMPLQVIEKKSANPLVHELATISEDLFKFSYNKIATKYGAFITASKSFEPGLVASEFKFSYLESWLEMVNKRMRKLGDYKERLAKIQERLNFFEEKLKEVKGDDQLRANLEGYCAKLKEKIEMTKGWLASSDKLFSTELNKLKSREKTFKRAKVPRA